MPLLKYRSIGITMVMAGLVIAFATPSWAIAMDDVPNPRRTNGTWVSDVADILSDQTEDALNATLDRLEAETTAEIAIVTVPDIKNSTAATPKQFAYQLFNQWGIGKQDKNNGILLLIAKTDRRVEIEVGKGLTNRLTNEKVAQIISASITPAFKQGNYDKGTIAGADAVIQAIKSTPTVVPQVEPVPEMLPDRPPNKFLTEQLPTFLLVIGVPILLSVAMFAFILNLLNPDRRRNDRRSSTSFYDSDSSSSNSSSDSSSSSDFGGGSSDSSSGGGGDW